MGQFDKNKKIEFILGNVESIKDALKKYQLLLQNDEAVINQVHDVEFVHVEDGTIKPLQHIHGDSQILEKVETCFDEISYVDRELDFNDTTSEGIFFSHALKYPELLEEVVKTVKEIVNYARRHNDTWEMWADDMTVFGIDPVYILAKKHPEYTYLMGAYLIPYWDTEHANYVLEYMRSIYLERGFDDEVMKAFCYCDNSEGRNALINNDWYSYGDDGFDLEEYFKENSEKYELFKSMMKDRFKNQRYIQYSESDHTERPIEDFYRTILNSSKSKEVDEDEEIDLEVMFIDDTYDNEAYKLHMEIEEYVGEPLTDPYKDPYADEDDDEEDDDNIWEDFFINGFEHGEEIWNYILYGEDESILEEIKPTNIIKLAKEKDLLIQKKIKWYIGEFDSFEGEFHNIFEDFMNDYYEEDNNGFIVNINGVDPTGRNMVIRALDVFTILLDNQVYSYDLYEKIVSYGVMNPNKFMERYDSKCEFFQGGLSKLIAEASWARGMSIGGQLNRIYEFMRVNREEALILLRGDALNGNGNLDIIKRYLSEDVVTRENQVKLYKNGLGIEPISIRVATYMLNKDFENRFMDDVTKFLMDLVEENWKNMFLEILKEESKLTESDLNLVKKHIIGKQMPPRELMMKVMKEGPGALTEEEKALLNPKADIVELGEILPILKEKLDQEIDDDDPQIQYEIFNTLDDDSMAVLIPALYLGSLKVRMPSSESMKRAIKILIELAPMRAMKSAFYITDQSTGADQWYDFKRDMSSLCKDKSKILAWEILEHDDDRYDALVKAYIEDEDSSGFSFIKTESRADIKEALSYLSCYEKERFYGAVAEEDESAVEDAQTNIFYDAIPHCIKDSLKSPKDTDLEKIDEMTRDLIQYIEGNIDINSIEYIKNEMDYLHDRAYFSRGIWRIDEEKRRRLLLFLKEFGLDGIEAASNPSEVEVTEYMELLMDVKVPYEIINEFLIDTYDEDAYCEFAMRLNPFEYVKDMSIGDRVKALEMASYKPSLADFIGDMANDSSDRVRSLVDNILGNYSEEDLNNYKYLLVKSFDNSNENGKEILKKYI